MAQGTAVAESRKVGDAGLVTVGIDVSDRYSHLCVLGDDGEIVREERVRTTTAALPLALYSDRHAVFRATAQQRAGREGSTQMA